MKRALVLGAGMVGSVMAADLAGDEGFQVTVADRSPDALSLASRRASGNIRPVEADLADPEAIARLASEADIVLGALSSRLGFGALRAVIQAGRDYCDISFMSEDFQELDSLARAKGVTVVTDCGVAPGMSHILAARAASMLSPCNSIEIYVGGLPRVRSWPYEYKAGFAPSDVIEEYTRPSRLVEHSREVIRPALSEPELLEFEGVGTLEAFNTDGLRSLVTSLGVPFMKEKTLRYPGHIALMRALRETGLFSQTPVRVRNADGQFVSVRPLDLTSALLFPLWTYQPGEEDLTVMRVIAHGRRDVALTELRWDLLDLFDRRSGCTSMSRTTAFPCAIVARMIAAGEFRSPGVNPPERIGQRESLARKLLSELERRGVRYVFTERSLPA